MSGRWNRVDDVDFAFLSGCFEKRHFPNVGVAEVYLIEIGFDYMTDEQWASLGDSGQQRVRQAESGLKYGDIKLVGAHIDQQSDMAIVLLGLLNTVAHFAMLGGNYMPVDQ